MRHKLSESYKTVEDDYYFEPTLSWFEQPINRSEIGKKAYQTFLKNGGTRDSKGRFSKKQKIDWEALEESSHCLIEHELKEAFKIFKNYGLIKEGVEI